MQVRGPMDVQGDAMKIHATRHYTFQELLNRIDLEYWRVVEHDEMNYTFIPIKYWGGNP